jgi:hypothetical protein
LLKEWVDVMEERCPEVYDEYKKQVDRGQYSGILNFLIMSEHYREFKKLK